MWSRSDVEDNERAVTILNKKCPLLSASGALADSAAMGQQGPMQAPAPTPAPGRTTASFPRFFFPLPKHRTHSPCSRIVLVLGTVRFIWGKVARPV